MSAPKVMGGADFHAWLVKLAMDAFDDASFVLREVDRHKLFAERVSERMAQAASVYVVETMLAAEHAEHECARCGDMPCVDHATKADRDAWDERAAHEVAR